MLFRSVKAQQRTVTIPTAQGEVIPLRPEFAMGMEEYDKLHEIYRQLVKFLSTERKLPASASLLRGMEKSINVLFFVAKQDKKHKEVLVMTLLQRATAVIGGLPEEKIEQVIQYAEFLSFESKSRKTLYQDVNEGEYIRKPGILKRKMIMAEDFDETPDCFKEYM